MDQNKCRASSDFTADVVNSETRNESMNQRMIQLMNE